MAVRENRTGGSEAAKETTLKLLIAVIVFLMFFVAIYALAADAPKPVPVLPDSAKLAIRNAQVQQLVAEQRLRSNPDFKTFEQAQQALQQAVQKALQDLKLNPAEYQLDQDLKIVAIPKPEAKK